MFNFEDCIIELRSLIAAYCSIIIRLLMVDDKVLNAVERMGLFWGGKKVFFG